MEKQFGNQPKNQDVFTLCAWQMFKVSGNPYIAQELVREEYGKIRTSGERSL